MWLNASLLFGILGAAVPILIHLVKGRKIRKTPWAAMRFLNNAHVANSKRLRLEDLLLLLIRCAIVALIAVALARPALNVPRAAVLGNPPVMSVIVFDRSASMSAASGAGSRFESAVSLLSELLEKKPPGSKAAVILAAHDAEDYIAKPTSDLTYVLSKIRQAPLLDSGGDLYPAIERAVKLLADRPEPVKELDVFTDGQASAFRGLSSIVQLLRQHEDIRARFFIVGDSIEKNLAVTGIRVEPGILAVNQPFRVEVRVANHSSTPASGVWASLSVNSDLPMDQGLFATLDPGEERALWLFARLRSDGHHVLTARIARDSMPADDQRSVVARAAAEVRVLLVNGGVASADRMGEFFYLKHALRPVPRAQWAEHPIKLLEKTPAELEMTRFEDFDVVILGNVGDMPQNVASRLHQFVVSGGGLWIGAGGRMKPDFYNSQDFSPAVIDAPVGEENPGETFFNLSDRALDHPVVNVWTDSSSGSLSTPAIWKYYRLAPRNDAKIIARYANNDPAILERDIGRGRVILWSTTFNTAWNDLGARANVFVPLCLRTLGRLANRLDERLTLQAATPLSFPAPVEWMNKDVRITREKRAYADDDQTPLSEIRRVESINGEPTLHYEQTSRAGAYEAASDSSSIRFAVIANPQESLPDSISETSLKTLGQVAEIRRMSHADSGPMQLNPVVRDLGFELAILLLALAAVELFLAERFSRSK